MFFKPMQTDYCCISFSLPSVGADGGAHLVAVLVDDAAAVHLGCDVVSDDFCDKLLVDLVLWLDFELVAFPLKLLFGLPEES